MRARVKRELIFHSLQNDLINFCIIIFCGWKNCWSATRATCSMFALPHLLAIPSYRGWILGNPRSRPFIRINIIIFVKFDDAVPNPSPTFVFSHYVNVLPDYNESWWKFFASINREVNEPSPSSWKTAMWDVYRHFFFEQKEKLAGGSVVSSKNLNNWKFLFFLTSISPFTRHVCWWALYSFLVTKI